MCPKLNKNPFRKMDLLNKKAFTREKLNKLKFERLTINLISKFEKSTSKHIITEFIKLLKRYEAYKEYPKFHEYVLNHKVVEYLYMCAKKECTFNLDDLKKIEGENK